MEFPGIKKEQITKLDVKTQEAIRGQISDLEKVIDKKEGILQGQDANDKFLNFPGIDELGDYGEKSRGEIKNLLSQLDRLTARFESSVKKEIRLIREIRRLSSEIKKDDTSRELIENLKKEISDDLIIHSLLTEQQSLLMQMHTQISSLSKLAKGKLGEYLADFDNIRSLLSSLIEKEEIPKLETIYNLAEVPAWVAIASKSSS